jgi:hypothetical protein
MTGSDGNDTYIHTYRNSPKRGTLKGANKRLMGNIQEATDTKSESSVEHDIIIYITSHNGGAFIYL